MRRREYITSFGAAAAWPVAARAQQPERIRRIGVSIGTVDDVEGQARAALLRQGFSELGWIEGRNILIDYRWVGGDTARAKTNAAELVSQKPDVIIANTTLLNSQHVTRKADVRRVSDSFSNAASRRFGL